jgi:predicted CXXCH cytochrome family protein
VLAGHVTPLARETPVPPPGDPDTFRLRFWSDGTARLTAYEYVGLTQSPCFRGGKFSCTSCHTMHAGDAAGQLAPDRLGDRACTQCHAELARDVRAHTHHAPAVQRIALRRVPHAAHRLRRARDSTAATASRCRTSRSDVEGGRPDACTACHADRDAAWAADRMRDFWGARYRARRRDPTARRWRSRTRWRRCTRAIRCSARCPWPRWGAATAACRPARAASRSRTRWSGWATRTAPFDSSRDAPRCSSIARWGWALQRDLAAYDVQAGRDVRDPALQALLQRFAAAARETCRRRPTACSSRATGSWISIASARCWDRRAVT